MILSYEYGIFMNEALLLRVLFSAVMKHIIMKDYLESVYILKRPCGTSTTLEKLWLPGVCLRSSEGSALKLVKRNRTGTVTGGK